MTVRLRKVINWNSLSDLIADGVLLINFCGCHSLSFTNTMFTHNSVDHCTWHKDTSKSFNLHPWVLAGAKKGLIYQLITTWCWVGSTGGGRYLRDLAALNIQRGSVGNICLGPLSVWSLTPTCRRASPRSQRLETLSQNGPYSLPLLSTYGLITVIVQVYGC